MIDYSKLIKNARKKNNMTQKQLASQICSQSMISDIECGKKVPSAKILEKLLLRMNILPSQYYMDNEYYSFLFNGEIEKLQNAIQLLEEDKLSDNNKFYYYFFKAIVFYYRDNLDEALAYFLYAEDFIGDVPLLESYHCRLYINHIEESTKKVHKKTLETIASTLFYLDILSESLILEYFEVFFHCLEVYYLIEEYDSAVSLGMKLLIFLHNSYNLKYTRKIADITLKGISKLTNSNNLYCQKKLLFSIISGIESYELLCKSKIVV